MIRRIALFILDYWVLVLLTGFLAAACVLSALGIHG